MCVRACVIKLHGCLTHARALSVSVPDIRDSVACHKEVHQALAENADMETDILDLQEKKFHPVGL